MTDSHASVRRVLLITLVLNLLVAVSKIVVGVLAGALAVLADGFHSLSDAAGNAAALVAARVAAQPPDEDHPYGHQRFETVGALVIGVLLLLTGWEVAQGVWARLLAGDVTPFAGPWVIAVLLVTLTINIGVSRYQRAAGVRLRSEILLADAANTASDVYVTLSVLASTALVWAGLPWMDAVVALVVVGLIFRAALGILRRSGGVLVDTAPYAPGTLRACVDGLPHVIEVCRVRSRGARDAAHIDVDVSVPAQMTTAQTAQLAALIRDQVTGTVRADGGEVLEVEVHFTPAS
ncbi:MAG: cation diffusion facilitator family transporter [Chloroflexota bacterium]